MGGGRWFCSPPGTTATYSAPTPRCGSATTLARSSAASSTATSSAASMSSSSSRQAGASAAMGHGGSSTSGASVIFADAAQQPAAQQPRVCCAGPGYSHVEPGPDRSHFLLHGRRSAPALLEVCTGGRLRRFREQSVPPKK